MSAKKTRDPIVCFSAIIEESVGTAEALSAMVNQFLKDAKNSGAKSRRYGICYGDTDDWGQRPSVIKLTTYK